MLPSDPLQGILKRLSQFYSRNRWTYKTHFFHFSFYFVSKTSLKNVFKFLQIIASYICDRANCRLTEETRGR